MKHRRDSLSEDKLVSVVRRVVSMQVLASRRSVHRLNSGVLDPGVLFAAAKPICQASSPLPVPSSAAVRMNSALTAQTSSQPRAIPLLSVDFARFLSCGRASDAFEKSSCNQCISAKHTFAVYASSGYLSSADAASVSFGASSPRLGIFEEVLEVVVLDAAPTCAAELALIARAVLNS